MTALAIRDPAATAASTSSLSVWAEDARQAAQIAVSLAKTPFVPASLRDQDANVTAANITAAILTGRELGLEPMAALRSIDVIQGTPALRSIALRAVVQAAGHELWLAESTATRAIVRGRRRGSDQVQEAVWTMDRAKTLGLTGKPNWRTQPAAMLIARATAECARLVAADAILGTPYTAEELDDGQAELDATPPPTDSTPPPARTARRRTAQPPAVARPPVQLEDTAPDPEPDFDEVPTAEATDAGEQPEPAPDAITKPQLTKLHILLGEIGINGRDEGLAGISAFIGRDVASSKDLTKAEASALIDELERRTQANRA